MCLNVRVYIMCVTGGAWVHKWAVLGLNEIVVTKLTCSFFFAPTEFANNLNIRLY